MMRTKFVSHDMKKSIVGVYDYKNMNMSGVIMNPYYEDALHFESTTQLLKLMEQLQDDISFPEKSMKLRSFQDSAAAVPPSEAKAYVKSKKPLASFEITILFRHNASWQGGVVWLEKAASAEFRSALELVFLIDSVLSS